MDGIGKGAGAGTARSAAGVRLCNADTTNFAPIQKTIGFMRTVFWQTDIARAVKQSRRTHQRRVSTRLPPCRRRRHCRPRDECEGDCGAAATDGRLRSERRTAHLRGGHSTSVSGDYVSLLTPHIPRMHCAHIIRACPRAQHRGDTRLPVRRSGRSQCQRAGGPSRTARIHATILEHYLQ